MEKKEARLFSQLEEARSLWEQESQDKERRTKELEELLFKKEEAVNELEREVRAKDKTLHERQEQIAVLVGALELEHSQDEGKQRLLNQAAELCALRAIQAQTERKASETQHLLKKAELRADKLQRLLEAERERSQELQTRLRSAEKQAEELERRAQGLQLSLNDKEREADEERFKQERLEFQLALK